LLSKHDITKIQSLAIVIIIVVAIAISAIAIWQTQNWHPNLATVLVVSTTTSLYDTGLLDVIEDQFESKYNIDLQFISAGTGLAIQHAQRGDADMILVHAPSDEIAFMKSGYGVDRKIIAYNFFAIVGPKEDPVGIRDMAPTEALKKLVSSGRAGKATWVSRGDDSGTHAKEKGLWLAAGFDASKLRDESWYLEAGSGMGKTLLLTNEKRGYTLADMGTYLKYFADRHIDLEAVVTEGKELLNVYSAIAVNSKSNPKANLDNAIIFIKYLASDEGQKIIGEFGVNKYQRPLFYPSVNLLKTRSDLKLYSWIEEFAFFEGSECPQSYRTSGSGLY